MAQHGGDFDPNMNHGGSHLQDPRTGKHGGAFVPGTMSSYSTPSLQPSPVYSTPPPQAYTMSYMNVSPPPQPAAPGYIQTVQQPMYQTYQIQPQVSRQESILGKSVETTQVVMTASEPMSSDGAAKEFPVTLKDSGHVWAGNTTFRWKNPRHIQLPRYNYITQQEYRHRDFARRITKGPYMDKYLHHYDGRLRKLIVACTDDIFEAPGTSTWRRTYVRKVSPLKVRLATWVIDFSYDPKSWEDWWVMVLRAIPAAFAIQFVFWSGGKFRWQFRGCYAPVPYRYWGEAKVWSNRVENGVAASVAAESKHVYRVLKPRHLCFLRQPYDDHLHGVDVRDVDQWEKTDGLDTNLSYLFVAYSTEHFSHSSNEDLNELHHIAETAARKAKVAAYWVAASCMKDPDQLESDVYRISDVLRGAQDMIIAVGQSKGKTTGGRLTTDALLAQWGTRVWTFPEVLLSPGQQIPVYTRGGNLSAPLMLSKNQFANRVWRDLDSFESRQLIDHYLGNLGLSRLELAITALKCLYRRETTEYLSGDQAYALMGLLRMRPQVDRTDSPFQAFARLSLANDSDKLLERYLCTLPTSQSQSWFDMTDAYGSALWDIDPCCQVAAICDQDTIILDGAHGASIRWKSFFPIGFQTGWSWHRWFAMKCMEHMTLILILSCVFFYLQSFYIVLGIIFLAAYFYILAISPRLIRTTYGGKFTEVQAAFFAFEGHLNAPTVERAIFGGNFSRMGWSSNGSPLSRANVDEHGERVGVDPAKDVNVRAMIERAKAAGPGQPRIFTLVDTYNMEMTLFEAIRPPTCIFLCGSEGGMQRAVACSYDWTTQTMYRETVLRLPTESLNRMDRVPRVRMGIKRFEMPSCPVGGAV